MPATLLGNSGSPRWYDGRFEAYLACLVEWGATAVELPVHHGPFDERTARVHLVEDDWEPVIADLRSAGLAVQLHVSLDPRFATAHWVGERRALQTEYEPVLALLREVAPEQAATDLIVHGASGPGLSPSANEDATVGLLEWLAGRLDEVSGVAVAVELTAANPSRRAAACRDRASLLRVVERVAAPSVGICWDLAHDVENAALEPGWSLIPPEEFLARVVHVHAHDMDQQGEDHYPPVLDRVPIGRQLMALAARRPLPPVTMEVRWRCAARLGAPWDLLALSYARMSRLLDAIECEVVEPGLPRPSR